MMRTVQVTHNGPPIRRVAVIEPLISILPRCKRCGGAFYPDPNPATWTSSACEDCWEIYADESSAEYEAYLSRSPVEYICYSPFVPRNHT